MSDMNNGGGDPTCRYILADGQVRRKVTEPFEARHLPELEDSPERRDAFTSLVIAVNGFPYVGDATNAIAYTLRWLRANPEQADVLLGRRRPC